MKKKEEKLQLKYTGISELATKYAMKHDITKKEADKRIRDILAVVKEELLSDETDGIQIIDFITLRKVVRNARVGRNPRNPKVEIKIPDKLDVKCILGKAFAKELNED